MSNEDKQNKDHKLELIMVVNGTPNTLEFPIGIKLKALVEVTLEKTGNTGQPIDNWELRDEPGNMLDLESHLKDYGFVDKTTLFLNPKIGAGGTR